MAESPPRANTSTPQAPASIASPRSPAPAPPGRVDSRRLFARAREIVIRHAGADYRLRITSQNKLILTK